MGDVVATLIVVLADIEIVEVGEAIDVDMIGGEEEWPDSSDVMTVWRVAISKNTVFKGGRHLTPLM